MRSRLRLLVDITMFVVGTATPISAAVLGAKYGDGIGVGVFGSGVVAVALLYFGRDDYQ